ncbi:MAG: hypothetical protein JXB50_04020 [Spirochaetes bacterium]|nr:hypothetical protein [Spirochaetota bacterium]
MNKTDKNVIITFDYELSLGTSSGTVEKCIIEPANIILEILNRYNSKAIFFADSLYILTLKKHKHRDFLKVTDQIKRITDSGHNVEFHLHPQWLDAYQINEREWGFKSFEKYRVHSLDKDHLKEVFNEGLNLLSETLSDVKSDYKIKAFRAGGWAVQPFETLKELFINNGLIYDFSVVPGMINHGKYNYFDFSCVDSKKAFWKFHNDPMIESEGSFYEIPLTTIKIKKFKLTLDYNFLKKYENEKGDGKPLPIDDGEKSKRIKKIINLFKKTYAPLSLDGLSSNLFIKLLKKTDKQNRSFLTAVGHPKKLSKSFVKNLEYLAKYYNSINLFNIKNFL